MPQDFDERIKLRGFHIPPYKLEYISAQANRIVKQLTDASRFSLTLPDVNLTLDLARDILNMEGLRSDDQG